MTLHLDSSSISELCAGDVPIRAARFALEAQRNGGFSLPVRLDVDTSGGFFRVMPAALGQHMGVKIMTVTRGIGNRYLLLVYSQETGELIASMDASQVTRLRTAAVTAVAGELLCPNGTDVIGIVGTGFEAESHLRAFARLWPLSKVCVYSRSAQSRREFATRLGNELGVSVLPVSSVEEVVGASPVTILCTKSETPVVRGSDFAAGAVVLSIGSTRPVLRELDVETFRRARAVLVDDAIQVPSESGDVSEAIRAGAVSADHLVAMHDWTGIADSGDGRDLLVFKSVGTALQDLALAATLITAASEQGLGRELGEVAELSAHAKVASHSS